MRRRNSGGGVAGRGGGGQVLHLMYVAEVSGARPVAGDEALHPVVREFLEVDAAEVRHVGFSARPKQHLRLALLQVAGVGDAVVLVTGTLLLDANAVQTLGVLKACAVDAAKTLP